MAQNASFLDCSSYVPTLKGAEWLHPATSEILDEVSVTHRCGK